MAKVHREPFVLLLFWLCDLWWMELLEVFGLRRSVGSQRRGDRLADAYRQRLDARLIPGDRLRMRVKGLAASGGGEGWGGGDFWLLSSSFAFRNAFQLRHRLWESSQLCECLLVFFFWFSFLSPFFPPHVFIWTRRREGMSQRRSEVNGVYVLSLQAGKVMQCWHFWLGLVLVPTMCLLKDFTWSA